MESATCLSFHFQRWLCYCKTRVKNLLSQQIHFLQEREGEQQSYIHLQPNLPLVITSALARADILPAKKITGTTTQSVLLLHSLFSASFMQKAFCKQRVVALTELQTNNLKLSTDSNFKIEIPGHQLPDTAAGQAVLPLSTEPRAPLPLLMSQCAVGEPYKAINATNFS